MSLRTLHFFGGTRRVVVLTRTAVAGGGSVTSVAYVVCSWSRHMCVWVSIRIVHLLVACGCCALGVVRVAPAHHPKRSVICRFLHSSGLGMMEFEEVFWVVSDVRIGDKKPTIIQGGIIRTVVRVCRLSAGTEMMEQTHP